MGISALPLDEIDQKRNFALELLMIRQSERLRSASPKPLNLLFETWLRGRDLNPRPLGYEPNELPGCSTPQSKYTALVWVGQTSADACGGAVWSVEFPSQIP